MQAPNIIAQVLERMMPVGSIVEWAPVAGGDAENIRVTDVWRRFLRAQLDGSVRPI